MVTEKSQPFAFSIKLQKPGLFTQRTILFMYNRAIMARNKAIARLRLTVYIDVCSKQELLLL